jgi:GT2 family glycosyltransferase
LHPFTAIRYLWDPTPGLSRARNRGLDAARHPVVAFLDDDVYVAPGWYRELHDAALAAGSGTIVTGQVRPEVAGGFAPSTRVESEGAVHRGRVGCDVLYSANMAGFRAALHAVGGFDVRLGPGTAFPAAEDNDLGFRLLEAGYTIAYIPEAIVYHRAWRDQRQFLPLRWRYGVGRGAFYAKHMAVSDHHMLRRLARDISVHLGHAARRWSSDRAGAYGDLTLSAGILAGVVRWSISRGRGR